MTRDDFLCTFFAFAMLHCCWLRRGTKVDGDFLTLRFTIALCANRPLSAKFQFHISKRFKRQAEQAIMMKNDSWSVFPLISFNIHERKKTINGRKIHQLAALSCWIIMKIMDRMSEQFENFEAFQIRSILPTVKCRSTEWQNIYPKINIWKSNFSHFCCFRSFFLHAAHRSDLNRLRGKVRLPFGTSYFLLIWRRLSWNEPNPRECESHLFLVPFNFVFAILPLVVFFFKPFFLRFLLLIFKGKLFFPSPLLFGDFHL